MAYNWHRRWIPVVESRTEGTDVASRAKAPQALWQLQSASDGVLFSEIRHIRCLILLGEPGIGKTCAAMREQEQLDAKVANTTDKTIWVDLLGCTSTESVRSLLFKSDIYQRWKAGTHTLTMFVDNVDQADIPVRQVVTAITNGLADAKVNRLQMRLVCRDYAWSLTLAGALEHVWRSYGETASNVGVYQLAPLSLDDIRLAVEANNSTAKDTETFLSELEAAGALPLAMVPITLDMLLKEPGYLTSSRTELYENGSKHLIDGKQDLAFKALDERLEIACRTAASMVLGSKHAVDVTAPAVHESSGALAVKDLLPDGAGPKEERELHATLQSGLFQGSGKRTWVHLSYAEFLAARYLSDESISLNDILEMAVAPDGKFPPHLHDCLRWLIVLRKDILPEIVKRQPLIVLAGDLSHLSDNEFEEVCAALLSLPDPRVFRREAWNPRNFRAGHPSAKRVLLRYLADTSRSPDLRYFVLRWMERLDVRDIDDVLARIALDEHQDQALRHSAAHRICDVGSVETKLQLKPYIYGRDDDLDDELKGCALQALWPDYLTADELFSVLSPRKREDLLGSYRMFLFNDNIANGLQPEDLPIALKWVAAQPARFEMSLTLNDLPSAIMRKAWENIHIQGVMEAFAETAVAMMKRFDYVLFGHARISFPPVTGLDSFEKEFVENSGPRRELALKCLRHMLDKEGRAFSLLHSWPPIIVADDLDWLLGLLDSEADAVWREQLAHLVAAIFPQLGSQGATLSERYRDIEKVYEARARHPELKERTQRYFIRMLDDSEAASDREHHRIRKEIEEKHKRQHASVRPFERLEESLDRLESGETWRWQNVIHALSHWPDGRSGTGDLNPDLAGFPLWKSCAEETRARIVRAALTFVMGQDQISASDVNEDWYDTNHVPYVELHGYTAICLLRSADTSAFEQLPADRWKRWAKIVVWYSSFTIVGDGSDDSRLKISDLQKDLVSRLHECAPYACLENLRSYICAFDRCEKSVEPLLNGVAHVWDARLESMLLGLLQDTSLLPGTQRSVLDFLWSNRCDEALRVAQARISAGYTSEEEKQLIVECSAFLLTCGAEFEWAAVWKIFQNDDDVGRTIVEMVAQDDWNAVKVGATLHTRELADLYIWVEERYPTSEEPKRDGTLARVTGKRAVYWWRGGIVTQLLKRESQEALEGVRRILSRFPNLEWLQSLRLDLEKESEGSEWEPVTPRDVLQLAPVAREQRYGKLRQWCRDNPAELTVIGLVIAMVAIIAPRIQLPLATPGNVVQPSGPSEDSISVTLTESEISEFHVENDIEMDSESHLTVPVITPTDAPDSVANSIPPMPESKPDNARPVDY